jgi:hypothetical protein
LIRANVCYRKQSGKHMLGVRFCEFGPEADIRKSGQGRPLHL